MNYEIFVYPQYQDSFHILINSTEERIDLHIISPAIMLFISSFYNAPIINENNYQLHPIVHKLFVVVWKRNIMVRLRRHWGVAGF